MQVKQIKIGNVVTKNNVFLAPIAGFTNYPFRHNVLPYGVGFCFTELISAKGLFFGGKNSVELLYSEGDYDKTGAQIFGSEPYYLRKACESEYLKDFSVVDINMGCPVPKVYKNGEGSALLKDIHLAEELIKECVKSGKNITVKIRTGLKYGDNVATEFAKMAENAGAKLITIHGRVREAYYSGEPDFKAIEDAKKSVSIPVIANGGIFTEEDAENMMNKTGADGIMLARGAIADPYIFNKLTGDGTTSTIKDFAIKFITDFANRYGTERACKEFRKYATYFYKGLRDGKHARNVINISLDLAEIISVLEETL